MPTTAEGAAGRRLALVVATGSYVDPTLAKLRAPGQDASDLAAVLEDAAVGQFEVEMVFDAPAESLRRRIAPWCTYPATGCWTIAVGSTTPPSTPTARCCPPPPSRLRG
jgi:hypothetical protein